MWIRRVAGGGERLAGVRHLAGLSYGLPACLPCISRLAPRAPQALAWAVECSAAGGAAAVARCTGGARGGPAAPPQDAAAREREAQQREREAQHRALVEESARVLRLFAGNAGVGQDRVRGIERVQNLQLYSDYTMWALDFC